MDIIGIDISKQWFDCYRLGQPKGSRFNNNPSGWETFIEWAGGNQHVIMEASGPYYLALASWLCEQGITVSVENPLVIRRYGQMKLNRTKTDAVDAKLIAEYARDQQPDSWRPPSEARRALQQLMSLREGVLRQKSIIIGQTEAFGQAPADPLVMDVLAEQKKRLQAELDRIDQRLQQLAETHYKKHLQVLLTIPGIGSKTAITLLAVTDGFSKFEDSRKLASYVGICPRVWQSGSSVKGRGSICKLGCGQLRKLLYMCSWSARKANPACKNMYERLSKRGKPGKVISVAIAHKLLRQAFAVGSRCEPFNKKKAIAA